MFKKFFVGVFLCLALLINFSTCNAANFVRVADENAESLHNKITTILSKVDLPVSVGKLSRTANLDLPAQGLQTWSCYFGVPNSDAHYGELIFFVNSEGNVFSMKVVAYNEQFAERVGNLVGVLLFVIGMSESEIQTLLAGFNDSEKTQTSSAWCQAKNRNFILMLTPRVQASNGMQILMIATDTKSN